MSAETDPNLPETWPEWPDKKIDMSQARFRPCSIVRLTKRCALPTGDLEMKSETHNYIANGIVVGNSHAVAYTDLSMRCLYLKFYFPHEYFASVLSNLEAGDSRIRDYIQEAMRVFAIEFLPPDVSSSTDRWEIRDYENGRQAIVMPLSHVKRVGSNALEVAKNAPYSSVEDFVARCPIKKDALESLINAGACDTLSDHRAAVIAYATMQRELTPKLGIGKNDAKRWLKETLQLTKQGLNERYESFCCRLAIAIADGVNVGTGKLGFADFREWSTSRWRFTGEQTDEWRRRVCKEMKKPEFDPKWITAAERGADVTDDLAEMLIAQVAAAVGSVTFDEVSKKTKRLTQDAIVQREQEAFGFILPFMHPLRKHVPDHERAYLSQVAVNGFVDCMITGAQARKTKTGKTFHRVTASDGLEDFTITVWSDAWDNYGSIIGQRGTCLRLCVSPPDPKFNSCSLQKSNGSLDSVVLKVYARPGSALPAATADRSAERRAEANSRPDEFTRE